MENEINIENQVPVGILTGIKFDILTEYDAERLSVISIETPAGVTDPKLGLPNPDSQCATCGARGTRYCEGHFGIINFPYTIIHPYYISEVIQILNKICPGCKTIRREHRTKGAKLDLLRGCKYCTGRYPSIRFKLSTNDLFKKTAIVVEVTERSQNKFQLIDYWDFLPKDNQMNENVNKNRRVLSHEQVYYLLKDIDPSLVKDIVPRKDAVFIDFFPVTPNSHRVMELIHPSSTGHKILFDDRTRAFRRLVDYRGPTNELASRVLDCLKLSKLRLEKSTDPSISSDNIDVLNTSASKWLKEVVLTKRSDHIIRSVVTGDPNLRICEIGIPCHIAERLQISDHLNSLNWDKLIASCNLKLVEKGEVYVRRKGALVRVCEMEEFQLGDHIYRPLSDGDVMLINRPPSIHQHSMLALYVKILPITSCVSINPLCCSPLRGDFDGDCLHGYVPQSMEARVELRELLGLDKQLRNGQNGKNLLSLSHDSLTAVHLLFAEGGVLSKPQIQQLGMFCPRQLLSPSIRKTPSFKSDYLWTEKQLFSMLLPPDFDYFSPSNDVHIRGGELLLCPPGSAWLRGDENGSLFESLINHCGGEFVEFLDAVQRVLCEWLSSRGLSVSLLDLYLCSDAHLYRNLMDEIRCGLEEAERTCHLKQLMVESAVNSLIGDEVSQGKSVSLEVEKLCYEKQKSAALAQVSSSAFKYIFRDIQNLTYHYAASDNSLLAMIKSGSKGNLLKVVQQSMCLGLQHSLVPLSFRLPHRLSCASWNELKTQSSVFERHSISKYPKSFIPFAVVESSFITGLNPLECFVHSVTSRDSTFSENADVPGTLTRKLTFFMRDIFLTYDGTVRNACGNQVVQFSYDNKGSEAVGGHPVGALAACALSEASYSALDQPVSVLESSPLLNFKKIMESGSRKAKGRRSISLFLSEKLRRLRYGYEHGALHVKNHLEKLLFSEIVSTVLIIYSPQSTNRISTCPWVCHFHVCKISMKKRQLKILTLIDALKKACEENPSLANAEIVCKYGCSADAEKDNTSMVCVTATINDCSKKSYTDMNIVRDVVIPSFLSTVVKGFPEIEKVDTMWYDKPVGSKCVKYSASGELYLTVTFATNCKRRKLWNMLMDCCLPIMGLIDWTRSYPDELSDIFSAFGIDVAWRSFLENLRSAANDIGKSILPEHLLLVADCLSVTGEFVGLSAKGMARQKSHVSVSAPFMLACFTNPGMSFIKAAKRGAADDLLGSLDALAWGKIPNVGTGGQFELIYSGKGVEIEKPLDVYSLLVSQTSADEVDSKVKIQNGEVTSESVGAGNDCKLPVPKVLKNLGVPKRALEKQITVDDIRRLSQIWKNILYKYPIDERLSDWDKTMVLMALKFHPRKKEKLGDGAVDIKIGSHSDYQDSRCFVLERNDGTCEDFSYKKCVLGALELIAPSRAKRYQARWSKNGSTKV